MTEGQKRSDIKYGMNVGIVLKADQDTGYITYGKVQKILTSSATHPHGIKVRLSSGEVGRVKEFVK
ncbi:MAG: YwbE family protein [Epsilonproteobacteria bacterium]|nr:MAG: YwbE family protein [Campylobacterota bacterium]